jgi:1-acyl-sn-glycerol-3-phosphate acyltransferase
MEMTENRMPLQRCDKECRERTELVGLSTDAGPPPRRYGSSRELTSVPVRSGYRAKERSRAGVNVISNLVLRWIFRGCLRLFFGLRVAGEANVPRTGGAILAANHASQMDPIVLVAVLPRELTFLGAAEVIRMPVLGQLVQPFHPVPIHRGQFDRVRRGEALLIFPEGKISTDGRLQPWHDGAAFLAYRSGVPIVPVGVRGTYRIWPLGTRLPHRGTIAVQIGNVIVPQGPPTRKNQLILGTRVMETIAALAGLSPGLAAGRGPSRLEAG